MRRQTGSSTRNVARFLNRRLGIERSANRQLTNEHFDDHHIWYPRQRYIGDALAHIFRNLPCQRLVTKRGEHIAYHQDERYPKPPSRRQMRKQILRCRANGCRGGACVLPILVIGDEPDFETPDHIVFIDSSRIASRP